MPSSRDLSGTTKRDVVGSGRGIIDMQFRGGIMALQLGELRSLRRRIEPPAVAETVRMVPTKPNVAVLTGEPSAVMQKLLAFAGNGANAGGPVATTVATTAKTLLAEAEGSGTAFFSRLSGLFDADALRNPRSRVMAVFDENGVLGRPHSASEPVFQSQYLRSASQVPYPELIKWAEMEYYALTPHLHKAVELWETLEPFNDAAEQFATHMRENADEMIQAAADAWNAMWDEANERHANRKRDP